MCVCAATSGSVTAVTEPRRNVAPCRQSEAMTHTLAFSFSQVPVVCLSNHSKMCQLYLYQSQGEYSNSSDKIFMVVINREVFNNKLET